MVLGEYFSMTQKERSSVQTTQFNGQSYDFNLATLPETKTSGFAVTPKLRLQYMISNGFGFFADASYTTGPKIETTVSKLIPNGNPSPQSGSYNIQQLQTGTMVKGETKSTAYSAMGFNFGVVIGLGGNGHGDNLTNGVVKPACTCCGSKSHDRISCPDITRCNTQTASSQVALFDDLPKAQGDIKKGWDGTVKGLFATFSNPNNGTKFITIDDKGLLTQDKKIEFENEIANKFPQAENIQSQIKTSDDIPYVETQFTYKGKQIFILRKIELTKSKFVIVKEYAVACNGKCNGQSYNCFLVVNKSSQVAKPESYHCNCETANCKFRVVDVTGGIKVTEFDNEFFTKED
jgi:hypothetical protein